MRGIDVEARWEHDVVRAFEGSGYERKITLVSFTYFGINRPELGVVVQECGDFLLTATQIQSEKVRGQLENDPAMKGYSFTQIFTKFEGNVRRIYRKVCFQMY